MLLKVNNRFKGIPIKIYVETQNTTKTKAILDRNGSAEGITIPDFRLYYRTTLTNTTQ